MHQRYDLVVLGLSISSSWGNGHATTYRALLRGLYQLGRRVLFLERNVPWYAANRDCTQFSYCDTQFYASLSDLRQRFTEQVRHADAVIVGSFVPEGPAVCDWVLEAARGVRIFYDIDTPVTLAHLRNGACDSLRLDQIPQFDLVLSFTGGPMLEQLQSAYGARCALRLYCSVDEHRYQPQGARIDVDLGYMGTYSKDRQSRVQMLFNEPARRLPARSFMLAGAQYPSELQWPPNVRRVEHIGPADHVLFYNRQRFTLNLTRQDMRQAGYSPSVRLFEAAACGTPIVSDDWPGLAEIFTPGEEILLAHSSSDVVGYLRDVDDAQRRAIARRARERVLAEHSGTRRAAELENHIASARGAAGSSKATEVGSA